MLIRLLKLNSLNNLKKLNMNQKLHYPSSYSFSREDIGRIVLFKDEEELSVYPFMIIFNAYQKDDTDDDLLFKDMLAPNYHRDETYTIGQLVGEFGYEYVQIVEDKDEDLSH